MTANVNIGFVQKFAKVCIKVRQVIGSVSIVMASFTIKTSALDYGYGKFRNDCHNESMKRSLTCMCPNCGNLFETGVNEVDRRIYCKKECFYESMMINIPKSELEKLYIDEDLTTREIALIYNTDKKVICDYLHRYEMEVEPATFPGGKMITCKDGHVVRSHYERALDNAFTAHGIEHEYEPRLPFDRRFASDFLVGDVYIEVWGMVGWKPYEKQMKKKKKLYEENNLKLFSVYPEDFKDVYGIVRKLKRLIS